MFSIRTRHLRYLKKLVFSSTLNKGETHFGKYWQNIKIWQTLIILMSFLIFGKLKKYSMHVHLLNSHMNVQTLI
jgi:hypothetical protein